MVVSTRLRMSVEASLRAFATRALSRSIGRNRLVYSLARRLGWLPAEERVRWFGARTLGEATRALTARAARVVQDPDSWVLMVGSDGALRRALTRKFERLGWRHRWVSGVAAVEAGSVNSAPPACVIATDLETKPVTRLARELLQDPRLSALPLEYVTGLEPEHRQFRRQDEYPDDVFISPLLLAEPSPYELYDRSLRQFEQKCGLRDFLDLYQLLVSVQQRGVVGEVAEFGSYKGHSGWLIASTLESLGSDKQVFLFDMFQNFPQEPAGIDYFWSGTHKVNLEEVRSKLSGLRSVHIVPGEFEQTVPESAPESIALAYVDCDSYRAVLYLANALFEDRLSEGGVMIFEDYGHPALLGCRVAVHEYFDDRTDCIRFFSQFSGLYVVVKATGAKIQS